MGESTHPVLDRFMKVIRRKRQLINVDNGFHIVIFTYLK